MTIQDIVRAAKRSGWTVERTGKNHLKFYHPNGVDLVVVGTIHGRKTPTYIGKIVHDLKKHGLEL